MTQQTFPLSRDTSELYGGGPELRLKQELMLGIGGWRLLRALGIQPDVFHLMIDMRLLPCWSVPAFQWKRLGSPFEVALAATRVGNLFTTHTRCPRL